MSRRVTGDQLRYMASANIDPGDRQTLFDAADVVDKCVLLENLVATYERELAELREIAWMYSELTK